jgi:hypothetical protein
VRACASLPVATAQRPAREGKGPKAEFRPRAQPEAPIDRTHVHMHVRMRVATCACRTEPGLTARVAGGHLLSRGRPWLLSVSGGGAAAGRMS